MSLFLNHFFSFRYRFEWVGKVEDLGGVGGRGTAIRILSVEKNLFSVERERENSITTPHRSMLG